MNTQLKITRIGNSAGVVLPKELLAHLDVAVGETLSVSKTPRGIELAPSEPDFEAQMPVAREVMARRRRALRELASSEDELAMLFDREAERIMIADRDVLAGLARADGSPERSKAVTK